MKPSLRLLLTLLLILSLPLKGLASGELPAAPCPMQAAGMSMASEMLSDCCLDGDSTTAHELSCKPGQDCKAGSLYQLAGLTFSLPLPVPSRNSLYLPDTPLQQSPSGVWRPPRV
ncbi:hypothetical protein [Pseudomonas sp. UBA2684]|uniref:hypothetical protein n=1 Tax=Pseudomonas sp. UBA2684 TaxID=1947311 RepID=UPI0025E91538|nr:hypothetical protein [Pseudomonas sp. UBA2684]|tara:strand:+ start:2896 stop:3240 length:345 start_codon:yes stop_codon:yes gene_type:complete